MATTIKQTTELTYSMGSMIHKEDLCISTDTDAGGSLNGRIVLIEI